MAINKIPDGVPPGEPVLHAPPGAAPRGLRSDPFAGGREEIRRPAPPKLEPPGETTPATVPANVSAPSGREWDFAMPASAPNRQADPHLDPDVNWRRHAGLRAPVETASFSETAREKFNENWERLASEPPRPRHGKFRRNLQKSAFTRWLFHNGHLDFGNVFGALLLTGLLVAAVIYGARMLSGSGSNQPAPAVHSNSN